MNELKMILQAQLQETQKALAKLKIALQKDIQYDELYLDGIIQRFEFTFEMIWKLAKLLINRVYEKECFSPKKCFKMLVRLKIFTDKEFLWDLANARNLTSHTYNLDYALLVYNFAKKNISKIEALVQALEKSINDDI